jgi:hypothetical protein
VDRQACCVFSVADSTEDWAGELADADTGSGLGGALGTLKVGREVWCQDNKRGIGVQVSRGGRAIVHVVAGCTQNLSASWACACGLLKQTGGAHGFGGH